MIKFKGKNSKGWLIGHLLTVRNSDYVCDGSEPYNQHYIFPRFFPSKRFEHGLKDLSDYQVDPSTICESTGLFNHGDIELWENDIVRFGGQLYVVRKELNVPGGRWASTAYLLDKIGWCDYLSFEDTISDYTNEIEVEYVGNTIDNPELLTVPNDPPTEEVPY